MKKRNIYKDVVYLAVFWLFASAIAGWGREYEKERKSYGLYVGASEDLTSEIVDEFRKLSGICRFEPADTAAVTIRLGMYTMETELMGINLEEYPLKWQNSKESRIVIAMGNTAALFFGEEAFSAFMDAKGYAPLKSQVEKWIEQYEALKLTVTDESGQERKAKICGILKDPGAKICMDRDQMKEIFSSLTHPNGGFLEIYGYKNTERARGLLEDAGFMVQQKADL